MHSPSLQSRMPFTPRLVHVTAPSVKEARKLAKGILEHRFAACVNIILEVESHYWWKGKLEKAKEVTLLIKSSREQFDALAGYVRKHHSYDCPEIVSVTPQEISPAYRSWWDEAMMKPSD